MEEATWEGELEQEPFSEEVRCFILPPSGLLWTICCRRRPHINPKQCLFFLFTTLLINCKVSIKLSLKRLKLVIFLEGFWFFLNEVFRLVLVLFFSYFGLIKNMLFNASTGHKLITLVDQADCFRDVFSFRFRPQKSCCG